MDSITNTTEPFAFDNSYARELEGFYVPWQGEEFVHPRLEIFNEELAAMLGLSLDLEKDQLAAFFAGSDIPKGAAPLAQVYAGHQFGGFSPQLGDGRALLMGEVITPAGKRYDIHLKGSGPTPFSRGGDGKAALGPVLREYLMGEAMHALGVPTTRALAAVTTGERIMRTRLKPGAVLARVASSHLRVGTFQFFAARGEWDKVRQLADYAIERHYPELAKRDDAYLAFLAAVSKRQAKLIARWMQVGFVHGVMNTDNMTISGETIDYGPCAFMDAFDLNTVFSSIDHHGRYAYGNQPVMGRWNLTRLAETLIPLINPDNETEAINQATDVLADFVSDHKQAWLTGMGQKIGLSEIAEGDDALIKHLFDAMAADRVDFTSCFRALADVLRGDQGPLKALFADQSRLNDWLERWQKRLAEDPRPKADIAKEMDRINPLYIPRNHLVEAALERAEEQMDLTDFKQLLSLVTNPFNRQAGNEAFEGPAPAEFGPHITYCGT
nr:YdiU family protein [uncultured Cohaesibacter sp.]